jgi:hypothetical protein
MQRSRPIFRSDGISSTTPELTITLILAREMRGRDITVNAVAPGPTATALFLDGKDEATIAKMAGQAPLERLGAPQDIAEVISFLAARPAGSTARYCGPTAASPDACPGPRCSTLVNTDSPLAVSYAAEPARCNIETTIIVPGSSPPAPTTSPPADTPWSRP